MQQMTAHEQQNVPCRGSSYVLPAASLSTSIPLFTFLSALTLSRLVAPGKDIDNQIYIHVKTSQISCPSQLSARGRISNSHNGEHVSSRDTASIHFERILTPKGSQVPVWPRSSTGISVNARSSFNSLVETSTGR